MAGFNAGAAVEKMSYDFTTIAQKPDAEPYPFTKGDIPEPSTEQVTAFWTEFNATMRRARNAVKDQLADLEPKDDDGHDERDRKIALSTSTEQKLTVENVGFRRQIVADVCSGTPPVQELAALPHRIFDAFESYVMGALTPEVQSAATTK